MLLLLAVTNPQASATTYYVDPGTGSNNNSGTAPSTPWLNPPGTRTISNSGFYSSSWGAITSAKKVACGDVILLKGGATQTSAQGGAWQIGPDFYTANCTTSTRITLRVAINAEWSGSNGPFTLNGTGMTPTYHPLDGYGDHAALIGVAGVNYSELKGVSANQRLIVQNSSSWSVVLACHNCSGQGFHGDYWELASGSDGFNAGNYTDWQISNSLGHNFLHGPWQTGLNNDQLVDRGGFVDVQGYDSGCGSVAAPSCTSGNGREDLFFFVGGRGVWCVNCQAHGAGERGVNTGVIQDANMGGDFIFRFRNLRAWDNGSSCSGGGPHYCAGAGVYVSGNDFVDANTSRNFVVGAVLFHNADMGAGAYGGGAIEVWNAVTYNTNWKRTDTGSYMLDRTAKDVRVFNSIDVRDGTTTAKAFSWGNANGSEPQKQYTPTSLSNCFRPLSSDSETIGVDDGTGWPGVGTYAAPPAWIPSASNKTGLTRCVPKFTALDNATYASNNFTLQTGSSALDTGRFLLLANGAGTNAATVNVKVNGGSGDPRNYFIAPNSFLDATADTIQIQGCGTVSVTGLTATSISFTPACSWADGAGIHLPWAGAAPDMGPFEFGLGTVAAPTLISVNVAP